MFNKTNKLIRELKRNNFFTSVQYCGDSVNILIQAEPIINCIKHKTNKQWKKISPRGTIVSGEYSNSSLNEYDYSYFDKNICFTRTIPNETFSHHEGLHHFEHQLEQDMITSNIYYETFKCSRRELIEKIINELYKNTGINELIESHNSDSSGLKVNVIISSNDSYIVYKHGNFHNKNVVNILAWDITNKMGLFNSFVPLYSQISLKKKQNAYGYSVIFDTGYNSDWLIKP